MPPGTHQSEEPSCSAYSGNWGKTMASSSSIPRPFPRKGRTRWECSGSGADVWGRGKTARLGCSWATCPIKNSPCRRVAPPARGMGKGPQAVSGLRRAPGPDALPHAARTLPGDARRLRVAPTSCLAHRQLGGPQQHHGPRGGERADVVDTVARRVVAKIDRKVGPKRRWWYSKHCRGRSREARLLPVQRTCGHIVG